VGEVWFKFDRATDVGMLEVNGVHGSVAAHRARLVACASLAPTWVQTCCVAIDGAPMNELERHAWLDLMNGLVAEGVPLKGVRLYGLARESRQPMAPAAVGAAPALAARAGARGQRTRGSFQRVGRGPTSAGEPGASRRLRPQPRPVMGP
jgi:hypothetical protein